MRDYAVGNGGRLHLEAVAAMLMACLQVMAARLLAIASVAWSRMRPCLCRARVAALATARLCVWGRLGNASFGPAR